MENEQKICLVHFYTYPGGIEVLIPTLIREFQDRQFQSFVIRPDINDSISVYNGLPVNVYYGSKYNLKAAWELYKFGRKEKESVFHVFNLGPVFLFILRLARVKNLIYSIHGTVHWKNEKQRIINKLFWKLAINHKKHLFTSNSEYSRSVFKNQIDSKVNIRLLYNPIDLERFNSRDICESGRSDIRKIIYSGRLDKGKGLFDWIKCASVIHNHYPLIKFELYGGGPEKEVLEELVKNMNAENYISLKGHTEKIEKIYREADLLLFLSEYESFGNVVVESILCGTPVIAAGIPSIKEIFKDYPEFLILPVKDPANAILEKLSNYQTLKVICRKASKEFSQLYSAKKHIKILGDLYTQFC